MSFAVTRKERALNAAEGTDCDGIRRFAERGRRKKPAQNFHSFDLVDAASANDRNTDRRLFVDGHAADLSNYASSGFLLGFLARNEECEGGAFAFFRLYADLSTVHVDDSARDGK